MVSILLKSESPRKMHGAARVQVVCREKREEVVGHKKTASVGDQRRLVR
ncbi:hypothetical protein RBSWK_05917 [Rhodopirellula baltica SWK14]|uniref:Uncharacterized protein n=1 Tax=Rhodopirellula baltica SWK14 TaxID=993516 RepID=L7C7H5_RHOBT|nr:hypothetical protein RBSWK_05917 [Rhodopirellula baltica SWK14]